MSLTVISGWNLIYLSKKILQNKLQRFLIPNLGASEKIGKVLIM